MLNLCSWHRKGHCLLVSSFSVMTGYVSRLLVPHVNLQARSMREHGTLFLSRSEWLVFFKLSVVK